MGKYFGDKEFYIKSAKLAVPSMLQQLLTSTMGIVDTMMVSWIGAVSAVGIGSQLEMMGFTVAFGVMEGTGIFASQYFGAKDEKVFYRMFYVDFNRLSDYDSNKVITEVIIDN